MIEQLEIYAKHLNASSEVLGWLRTTGKKAVTIGIQKLRPVDSDIEHILDYLVSSSAPKRLQKMSFVDAKRKAAEWSEANQKKGRGLVDSDEDIETIHDFFDGTKIVKLKTKKAFQREGFMMSHCAGGYTPDNEDCHIYSYRDAKNMPHATFEVQKSHNEIIQIKGKGNGVIHPKYIHPILVFLEAIGMKIRPIDMINLGYHHIHKDHVKFLGNYETCCKQLVMILGEAYAY